LPGSARPSRAARVWSLAASCAGLVLQPVSHRRSIFPFHRWIFTSLRGWGNLIDEWMLRQLLEDHGRKLGPLPTPTKKLTEAWPEQFENISPTVRRTHKLRMPSALPSNRSQRLLSFVGIRRDSNRVCNKTSTVNARLARRLGRLRQPAKGGIFPCGRRARRPYRRLTFGALLVWQQIGWNIRLGNS
jgi:hypothetical protein